MFNFRPFATLPPDEQGGASKSLSMAELSTKRQKDKKSFILSNDNTGSSNNGDHSDRSITEHSPPLLRVRRKNTESKDRRRTQEIQPKENEKVKAIQTAARSRKSSPIVLPDQELLTVPRLAPTTPVEVPPLPSGRTLLDIETTMDIDQLFTQLFTDCQWYRDWLFVSSLVPTVQGIIVSLQRIREDKWTPRTSLQQTGRRTKHQGFWSEI